MAAMKSLDLKIPPPLVALLCLVLMWLVNRLAPAFDLFDSRPAFLQLLVLLLILAGAALGVLAILGFRKASTTIHPTDPHKTTSLVVTGVYRYSRNPMYLGVLLILISVAVYFGNVLAIVVLVFFVFYINRFQIRPEERILQQHFGSEFTNYTRQVRRWI